MIRRGPITMANEIRMKRSQFPGTFLVVEGKDDRLFCEKFVDTTKCKLEVAQGKGNVCEVVDILDRDGFAGVLGIVDADFDRVENCSPSSGNIISMDNHDLETMLVRSPALDRVLVEFGSQDKISKLKLAVRDLLVGAAMPISHLRLHSLRHGLGLTFDGLNYGNFLNLDTLEINRGQLVQEVMNRSQRHDLDAQMLELAMASIEELRYDPWELCVGEDLMSTLAVGLRRALGTNSATAVKPDGLKISLRLAYSEAEFDSSNVATAMQEWEMRNGPFQVR